MDNKIFKRKIYDKLLNWKKNSNGKSALLIEGARRVGKSTIVQEFAKNEYESYIMVDFSNARENVITLFDDLSDLNYIFLRLQFIYRAELHERRSLIIFDEIQFCPKARQAIKTFVKDGRYDYIETGSLISIQKNVKNILIPSEEDSIQMYPMDYEEFLWAKGDTATTNLLKTAFEKRQPLGEPLNRKLLRDFRLYMLVGGMPQAVDTFITTNNFMQVDNIKRRILKLYDEDFRKIDPSGRISILFNAIPAELNKNSSRYHISSVIKNARNNNFLTLLADMESSKTVLFSYYSSDPQVGMSSYIDLQKYKIFLADTGLFVTLMFNDRDFAENIIYEKLLSDKLSANLGYLYENIVAQTLASKGDGLFYYTFSNASSKRNYEIDFLISRRNKICPLEVKSSSYKSFTSLNHFIDKYSDRILNNYVICSSDLKQEQNITYLPVYMTQFI